MSESKSLKVVENLLPEKVFQAGGIQPVLDAITEEVSSTVCDVSTAKGRKEIASNAYKVAQSKTLLDKMGKGLADDLNAKLKPINAERKLARDYLDGLKDKVRKPLTEWEAQQAEKEAQKKAQIAAEELKKEIEYDHELALLMDEKFNSDLAKAKAEQEEAERIRQQEAKELRDKELAAAHEKAKLEAERAAQEQIEQAKQQQEAAEERERQQERDRIAAEERAKYQQEQAELAREAAKKQAKIDAELAAKKAKEQEIKRQVEEVARLKTEEVAREKNRANVARVRGKSKDDLIERCGLDNDTAKSVVLAISKGLIENISIKY